MRIYKSGHWSIKYFIWSKVIVSEMKSVFEVPSYLNKEFFKKSLEDGLREPLVTIKELKFTLGSECGENFCSCIFRVFVLFVVGNSDRLQNKSLIVKSIPIYEYNKFLEELAMFEKEKVFYYDILPKMEILLNNSKIAAKCYNCTKHPVQTIVFEDLNESQYTLASRQKGLDFEHSKLLLKKLGQFHGVSMVLLRKEPEITKHFKSGMLSVDLLTDPRSYLKKEGHLLTTLAGIVSKWEGYEKISQKILRYSKNLLKNLIKANKPREGEIVVLNHGDLWVNNFMFKYENGEPKDVTFVDFQCSFFGSPGCDINFFLNSSVQLDTLMYRRNELAMSYYHSLKETLLNLRYDDVPSFKDIQSELLYREPYGFYSAYSFLPLIAMDKKDSADNTIENMRDDEFAKKKMEIIYTSTERTLKTLRYTLKRFDELGVLD